MDKRSIRQKFTRNEAAKKPYTSKHGMTAQQIHKALQKTNSGNNKKEVRKRAKPDLRPKKKTRGLTGDLSLLLEIPAISTQTVIQYPTPKWFTSTEKADISIIIPMHKSSTVLQDLIASWDFSDTYKQEVIMVDDACPHNSKEHALSLWTKQQENLKNPVGKIVYNTRNQGFGVSCNIGASYATGDILIFLNADTVVTSGWVRTIMRVIKKDKEVGIVGNLQVKHGGVWKDTIDSAGSQWDWDTKSFRHIGRDTYNGVSLQRAFRLDNCPQDLLQIQEREMVTGACFAIRSDLFNEIGGFNPHYRIAYWEDSELCMAVREKGYKIIYQPNSKIYHKGSHTRSSSHKYAAHNMNYFANKWVNSGRIDRLVSAPRKEPMKEVGNILLRRQSAGGDVLIASGVAAALKKKYPHCKVMFNTQHVELLQNNPHIDKVIQNHEISERLFQLYYNLDAAYEFRPNTNIIEAYTDVVGVDVKDCEWFIEQKEVPNLPSDYIVMHAGNTRWVGRNWSPMKFEIIASKLRAQGRKLVLVGGGRDHLISNDVDLTNRLNTHELAYVINNARMFVGIDSFPMHVAQIFKTPGVCFFGSIDPKTRLINDSIQPIQAKGLSCLGCHHRQPPPSVVTAKCEIEVQECVNKVSIPKMLGRIEEVWESTTAS